MLKPTCAQGGIVLSLFCRSTTRGKSQSALVTVVYLLAKMTVEASALCKEVLVPVLCPSGKKKQQSDSIYNVWYLS